MEAQERAEDQVAARLDGELDTDEMLRLLRQGDLEIEGRLADASNVALYCTVRLRAAEPGLEVAAPCIYKPTRGERPLDDFPRGTLAARELAAYLLSNAFAWDLVPPTAVRGGPLGTGMVQLWVDVDESADPLEMVLTADPRLRRMAVLDIVANNADRKGSHLLPRPGGAVQGIDHGICFHEEPKLRTVLWGWRGEPLTADELAGVERARGALQGSLADELRALLSPAEVRATLRRAEALLASGCFPLPDPTRPAIPWPPF